MILCGVKYSLSVDVLCFCVNIFIYILIFTSLCRLLCVLDSQNRRAPRTLTCFDKVYFNPAESSTVFCLFYSTLPGTLVRGLSCFRFFGLKREQCLSLYYKVNP